jgi:hypothetical protein
MDFTKSDAVFSDDKVYRYRLERWWSPFAQGKAADFILCNPSTATKQIEDPTIRRCVWYAHDWGFDGLIVTNLFALRSTDPKQLKVTDDPVGPANDAFILGAAQNSALVVCGWGNWGRWKNRGLRVESMLQQAGVKLHCLGKTHAYRTQKASPQPKHPLYLRREATPEVYG